MYINNTAPHIIIFLLNLFTCNIPGKIYFQNKTIKDNFFKKLTFHQVLLIRYRYIA